MAVPGREEDGKPYAHLVRPWKSEGPPYKKPLGECFAPHLTELKKIGDGLWREYNRNVHGLKL